MPAVANCSQRLKVIIRGAVQGVGFRPFVFRLASDLKLCGWVNNSGPGVFIEVEGPRGALETFLLRLAAEKPPHSFFQSLEASWLDCVHYAGFEIRESESDGNKTALLLPDIATCPDCLREIFDPANRRYRYPFTNCTHCGPRYSIIHSLPYDRANTSMRKFTMCRACRAEYNDPAHRRFHAQPNACPVCGPHLEFWEIRPGFQPASDFEKKGNRRNGCPADHDALLAAAHAVRDGKTVAVKGLGGFHLLVDARNERAVQRLRERKHREEKPFALMFPSLASVKAVCAVSPLEERLLCAPEAPMVLLKKSANHESQIVNSVAAGNPNLGVMLPSNPLHHLLMAELKRPVVATSGNASDEPICTDEREGLERLGGIADVFLVHNRPIVRHVDDSIVRVMLDRELVLRRARGYAPLPVSIGGTSPASPKHPLNSNHPERGELVPPKSILAVGAHLKNSVALAVGDQVFLSQHIGDLETEPANAAFRRVISDLKNLYAAQPQIVAADLHPDYLSTKYARELAGTGVRPARDAQHGSPAMIGVQHHIAHVLSCMAENEVAPPLLGVSWDGTGYGLDGTIWGGEFFLITDTAVERVAHLRSFRLPGGARAVKEPRRAALGLLYEMFGEAIFDRADLPIHAAFSRTELAALKTVLAKKLNAPATTSAGRLFDAVASLTHLRQQTGFEGQAAMELEFALAGTDTDEAYVLPMGNAGGHVNGGLRTLHPAPRILDWAPMIKAILADSKGSVAIGKISAKFHNALVAAIISVAKRAETERVVLSGGCFQNRHLTERTVGRLEASGFRPYWHQRVPPNDGGIALGQVIAALRQTD